MAASQRAARAALRVLAGEQVTKAPVPIGAIAAKYALVMYEKLPDEVSGMLLPLPKEGNAPKWAIVVNDGHAPVRQRFTIAHELGHLLMHRYTTPHADGKFVIRFRNATSSTGSDREEIEANQFAAELLMPERLVLAHATHLGLDLGDADPDSAASKLSQLAKRFAVSVQAISFRVAHLTETAV
jgi:hypothetical protein